MISNKKRMNEPQMDPITILKDCAKLIEEKKGENIIIIDLRDVNSYLDFFLIATGNSHIHCRSLARSLMKHLTQKKISVQNKADLNSGWILLDYSDIIIHFFTQEMREFYQLEKLWGDGKMIAWE